jgi:3-oxoacyl-[acyl-carrier protein] reductase
MNGLLADKVAVIYGGGGAIGGATAKVFAREGARVYLAGRTAAKLERTAAQIRDAGGDVSVATVDVFDEAAVQRHVDGIAAETGGIDILFNGIGITHVQGKSFTDTSLSEFELPVTLTVRSQFIPAQAVARHMVARKSGVILTLTTPGGRMAGTGFLSNGVFSAATEAFSRLLAAELGRDGIRVVCLRPDAIPEATALSHANEVFEGVAQRAGTTVHKMLDEHARNNTLLGRLPRLGEVAECAAFAASDRAGPITGAILNLTCGSLVD